MTDLRTTTNLTAPVRHRTSFRTASDVLNGRRHMQALILFTIVVASHWAEHATQAVQIWVFDVPRPQARGVLGEPFPWLVSSEWMHYLYALVMLVGFAMLLPGFSGAARNWWTFALVLQIWHHAEHLILLVQKLTGRFLGGEAVPTSVAQLWFPRIELHLFYNVLVTIPMAVAMYFYCRRPGSSMSHPHPTKGADQP